MRTIDAEELHNKLFRVGGEINLNAFMVFEKLILDAPTINTTKYGEWIEVANYHTWGGTRITEFKCSLCNKIVNWHKYNYCPYCGAEMK